MRTHRRYARYATQRDAAAFHRAVRAENLLAARLDPGYSLRVDGEGLLDLTFSFEGRIAVVPFVLIQSVMFVLREKSPYIWPEWLPQLRRDVVREIEERLDPWISSLMRGRYLTSEAVRVFGGGGEAALFARARERGFLGAAPSETVLRSLSPYVYALRFAAGKRVRVIDPGGANGAALLARVAERVDADLRDAQALADARAWFDGASCFGEGAPASYDVAIGPRGPVDGAPVRIVLDDGAGEGERQVEVASAIPPKVMVSFDLEDSVRSRAFAVASPAVEPRAGGVVEPRIVGGSAGRIALVVRGDYPGNDDADIDEARALESRLNEQGFSASLVPATHLRPEAYDLLHLIGRRAMATAAGVVARGNHPPIVVSPYFDDRSDEAAWGAAVHSAAISNAPDETLRELYFGGLASRKIEAPNAPSRGTPSPADPDIRASLARAAAAVVTCEDEAERLRGHYGFAGTTRCVPAILGADEPAADVGSLVGERDFIFMHAPVEPRCNQFSLVRAAASLGHPLVLCGSVQDVHYYSEVMAEFGDGAIWLGAAQLRPGELAALYRRARVFADISWSGAGLGRLARAAASGAALVASSAGYARNVWPGLAQIADPASPASIRAALQSAWQRSEEIGPLTAARTADAADPFRSLVAVLGAYQAAAQTATSRS